MAQGDSIFVDRGLTQEQPGKARDRVLETILIISPIDSVEVLPFFAAVGGTPGENIKLLGLPFLTTPDGRQANWVAGEPLPMLGIYVETDDPQQRINYAEFEFGVNLRIVIPLRPRLMSPGEAGIEDLVRKVQSPLWRNKKLHTGLVKSGDSWQGTDPQASHIVDFRTVFHEQMRDESGECVEVLDFSVIYAQDIDRLDI